MEYSNKKLIEESKENFDPVLKKHVGLIHCENKLSFLQRKISNMLLYNAFDGLEKKDIHEMPLKQLCSLIGYRSNDINLIKKAIKGLIATIMEWNLLDDHTFINGGNISQDKIAWNASSLLAGATIENGIISYSYSPQIKTILSSLEIYGRINLFVQAKFNSVYSLVLYENCVRFKNIGKTGWFKLGLFRTLVGLTNGQYESFKELKRNVINPAIKEINNKSDIHLEVDFHKLGRTITAIKFFIEENGNYQPSFKRMLKAPDPASLPLQNNLPLIDRLISEFDLNEKQAKELIAKYGELYILEKIELMKKNKKVEKPVAYLMAAIKNDYKETKKPKQNRVEESTYLRVTEDAYEVRSLKRKYIEYKFKEYNQYLSRQSVLEKAQSEFLVFMRHHNPVMASLFQKNNLKSQPAMLEFMSYIDQAYPDHRIALLEFDEFLTEEEVV